MNNYKKMPLDVSRGTLANHCCYHERTCCTKDISNHVPIVKEHFFL